MHEPDQDTRPEGARVTLDMVGAASPELPVAWSERDTMLYALGVGAGLDAPESELAFTTENTEGHTLQAVPSFLTTLTAMARTPAFDRLDQGRFLHAEQWIGLPAPLPPAGEGIVVGRLESVLDKGSDAILVNHARLLAADDRRLLGEARSSIFVRGAGGFGGPRGEFPEWREPDRAADVEVEQPTRPDQALLYRLSGDRHRLHSDPAFARQWGFERPILHGLCTYGMACRALVNGLAGGDASRLRSMDGRFRKPVIPGDRLVTRIWREAGGEILFRTLDGSGAVVFDRGRARLDG